jgi:hypothetical protein
LRLLEFLKRLSPPAWLMILFFTGLLARLAVTFFFADNKTLYFEHMIIARNLLDGKGYSWFEWGRMTTQPSALIPPLYVYWCAFFQWLSSADFTPMYAAQAIVAASGCWPAFRLGQQLFSTRVGLLFAGLYAWYPEFVFLHSRAVAESIYVVLVLWMLDRYLALQKEAETPRSRTRQAVVVGVVSGIAMLVKEGAAIVAMSIILALLLRSRDRWVSVKRELIPMGVAIAVVLSPWILRNELVLGHFIPIRTGYAINWWVANHPGTAQNPRAGDPNYVFTELPREYNDYLNRKLPADEHGRGLVYAREVVNFIKERPGEYAILCLKRLWHYVWFVPGHYLASNWIYRLSWIALLLFAVPGMVLAKRRHGLDVVLPLIIVGYLCLYIPVIVVPRYRIVTVMLLLMFAAVTMDRLLSRYGRLLPSFGKSPRPDVLSVSQP